MLIDDNWIFIITSVIILVTLYYVLIKRNHWQTRGIPYLKPIPIFGNVLPVLRQQKSIGQFFQEMYSKSKEMNVAILGFWSFNEPCLLISDIELIKHLLVKDFQYFADRAVCTGSRNDSLGCNNILGMKNPHWKNVRSRLSHLFSSSKMKHMFNVFDENSDRLLNYMQWSLDRSESEEVEIKHFCGLYTVSNILLVFLALKTPFLSTNSSAAELDNMPIMKAAFELLADSPNRSLEFLSFFIFPGKTHWFNYKFFGKEESSLLQELFWEAVNIRMNDEKKGQYDDLLDKLMQYKENNVEINGLKYDGDVLAAQFAAFFTAGYETSSTSIALTLHHLAWNPEIQVIKDRIIIINIKLREEISRVMLSHNGKITYEGLSEMILLDMVYKETLRLYPTLPFIDRLCIKDYKLPETDFIIEKGTKLYISLSGIQRDEKYWTNPNKFDPFRFTTENKANIKPFSYLPFGEGPRICIGERMGIIQSKLGLAKILSKFYIEKVDSFVEELELSPRQVVTTPNQPIKLKLITK